MVLDHPFLLSLFPMIQAQSKFIPWLIFSLQPASSVAPAGRPELEAVLFHNLTCPTPGSIGSHISSTAAVDQR